MGKDWFCTFLDLDTLAKGVTFRCQYWYVHNDFNRSSDRFCEQEQNWGQYLQLKRTVLGGGEGKENAAYLIFFLISDTSLI